MLCSALHLPPKSSNIGIKKPCNLSSDISSFKILVDNENPRHNFQDTVVENLVCAGRTDLDDLNQKGISIAVSELKCDKTSFETKSGSSWP